MTPIELCEFNNVQYSSFKDMMTAVRDLYKQQIQSGDRAATDTDFSIVKRTIVHKYELEDKL